VADRGSTVYTDYCKDQIDEQEARKESIEKRGLAVVTTSGTIVSLLFGLVAVLTGADKYELPSGAEPWLGGALGAFAVALLAGIVTNVPLLYLGVEPKELRHAIDSFWNDSSDTAEKRVAATHVKILARAKALNAAKGWILVGAYCAQLVAVVCLALAVRVILVSG
jgi:hypothetical protein